MILEEYRRKKTTIHFPHSPTFSPAYAFRAHALEPHDDLLYLVLLALDPCFGPFFLMYRYSMYMTAGRRVLNMIHVLRTRIKNMASIYTIASSGITVKRSRLRRLPELLFPPDLHNTSFRPHPAQQHDVCAINFLATHTLDSVPTRQRPICKDNLQRHFFVQAIHEIAQLSVDDLPIRGLQPVDGPIHLRVVPFTQEGDLTEERRRDGLNKSDLIVDVRDNPVVWCFRL